MKKIANIVLVIFLIFLLVYTVGIAAEQEETVIFSRGETFLTLDPHDNKHTSNSLVDKLIYDRLIERDNDGNMVPGLAERWEISEDQKQLTFYLREGVTFHNGEPFTAEAVQVTIHRLRDNPSLIRASALGPDHVEKVDIIDDYTCVLHLKKPYAAIFDVLMRYIFILPPKAFTEQGVALFDHPIGTGPYKFDSYEQDVSFVVVANKDYWQEEIPRVDKIIYKPILEASTQIAALLTGEVDIVDGILPDQIPLLEQDPDITILRGPGWDALFYTFNCANPILNDVRVRTAIDLATDREYIVELTGGGAPAYIMSKPGMVGYTPDIRSDYDPEKARELLAETGYTAEELTFDFKAPIGYYPKTREQAVAIQSMMSDVGITFNVEMMEGAAFTEARAAAKYDIFITGANITDPGWTLVSRVVNDRDNSSYVNEELNKLLMAAEVTVDPEQRHEIFVQAYEIMFKEKAPLLVFYEMEVLYAHRNRITNFPFNRFKSAPLRTVDTIDNPGPVK